MKLTTALSDFPQHELYEQYTRASRVYVNRAGSVPTSEVVRFETLALPSDDPEPYPEPEMKIAINSAADKIALGLHYLRQLKGL